MVNDQEFKDWKIIRNILIHRSLPGRVFHEGGDHHGEVLWECIQIDKGTTVSKRNWLVRALSKLLRDADTFTNNHLFK